VVTYVNLTTQFFSVSSQNSAALGEIPSMFDNRLQCLAGEAIKLVATGTVNAAEHRE